MNSKMALTRCVDYQPATLDKALAEAIELLGGWQNFIKPGEKVLIKPNFIAPRSRRCATQTDPAVIIEIDFNPGMSIRFAHQVPCAPGPPICAVEASDKPCMNAYRA